MRACCAVVAGRQERPLRCGQHWRLWRRHVCGGPGPQPLLGGVLLPVCQAGRGADPKGVGRGTVEGATSCGGRAARAAGGRAHAHAAAGGVSALSCRSASSKPACLFPSPLQRPREPAADCAGAGLGCGQSRRPAGHRHSRPAGGWRLAAGPGRQRGGGELALAACQLPSLPGRTPRPATCSGACLTSRMARP